MGSLKAAIRRRMEVLGRIIGAMGVSANFLTLFGLLLVALAAAVVATGYLVGGGILFLGASVFDMLDGAVARATGTASRFGAFLDSVTDRYAESLIFLALIIAVGPRADVPLLVGLTAALVGSLLVSYARARAEGLGLSCEVGILQHPERVILLGIGLIFPDPLLPIVVWVLAVVTHVTVIQRVLHVRALLRDALPSLSADAEKAP